LNIFTSATETEMIHGGKYIQSQRESSLIWCAFKWHIFCFKQFSCYKTFCL